MHRTDAAGAQANQFVDKNPAQGVPGTIVDAAWLNAVQEEIAAAIEAAGITLIKGNNTQLLDALRNLGAQQVNDVATLRGVNPVGTRRVYVKGHTVDGIGGGHFRAVTGAAPGTYTDDDGYTIVPTSGDGSAAWLRDADGPVYATEFGAVPLRVDADTDSTAALQNGINHVKKTVSREVLDLGGEEYLISTPLVINQGDTGLVHGKLVADAVNFTADGTGSTAMIRQHTGLRVLFADLKMEGNFVASGIHNESGGFNNRYIDLEIYEGKDFGIRVDAGGDSRISHCLLTQSQGEAAKRTGIGLDIRTADVKINNTTSRFWGKNIAVNGNTLLATDCHFYNGNAGIDTPLHNSINIQIDGGSGCTFANCYIDKGRIVLKTFKHHFVGNRYLFTTSTPEHDSIFVFDAVDTVNAQFPLEFVHEGNYSTIPIAEGDMDFAEFVASGSGSWDASALAYGASLGTGDWRSIPRHTTEHVEWISGWGRGMYKGAAAAEIWYDGYDITNVPRHVWADAEMMFRAPGLTQRAAATGTLTTGTHKIEGSRTGVSRVAVQRLSDRRGSSDLTLSDTALAFHQLTLYGASTGPGMLVVERSDPGSADIVAEAAWTSAAYQPGADNTRTLGSASYRWSEVFAANGTINTSDERSKTDIEPIDEAVLRAWGRVQFAEYRFRDAVDKKGAAARTHFGVIAQRVKEAFEAEGLDPFAYGVLCYDEWEAEPAMYDDIVRGTLKDKDGNVLAENVTHPGDDVLARHRRTWIETSREQVLVREAREGGNQYGIRYEEAYALECAYLRARLDGLEK